MSSQKTDAARHFTIVEFIYIGRVFGQGTEFRKTLKFSIPLPNATITGLRQLGILEKDSLGAVVPHMKIDQSGYAFRFPAGDFVYLPEVWFWNLGTAENEYCAYAIEQYELLLPELRVPRKRGVRGKAVGLIEHWEKRKALEAWVYYYRNIEKLGLAASVRKALDFHPELVPPYLEDPEAALLKSTKLNN